MRRLLTALKPKNMCWPCSLDRCSETSGDVTCVCCRNGHKR